MKKLTKRVLGASALAALGASALPVQALDGYNIIGNATCGILHERISDGKKVVMLWGDKNDLGYSHGWLLAEQVKYSCSDEFVKALIGGLISGNVPDLEEIMNDPVLFNTILDLVGTACETMMVYATQEMRDEISSIVTGAEEHLGWMGIDTGQISYNRLCLANLGFDVACSVIYPFAMDQLNGNAAAQQNLRDVMHACDSFVVNKNGTDTGGTIMGRNFMNSKEVFGNAHGIVFDLNPKYGCRFAYHSFAGSVGLPVGMNVYGVAIGMNMAPGERTNAAATGMGCLLQARYTLQYKTKSWTASESIRWAVSRGTPWIYPLGGPSWGGISEAGATDFFGGVNTGGNEDYYKMRWTDSEYTGSTDWKDDRVGQWENDHRYAVGANHFIDNLVINKSGGIAIDDSILRYNFLNKCVKKVFDEDGVFTFADAKSLVNYQDWRNNGPDSKFANEILIIREDGYHWPAHKYYWGTKEIGGSRTAFDLKNKVMAIKYGLYTDEWVTINWLGAPEFREKPWYVTNY